MLTIELIPEPEHGGYTARVPDIPAYGEGETEDEAIADLTEALRGYLEAFGLDDALSIHADEALADVAEDRRVAEVLFRRVSERRPGHRDTLVLTYRAGGFQGPGAAPAV